VDSRIANGLRASAAGETRRVSVGRKAGNGRAVIEGEESTRDRT